MVPPLSSGRPTTTTNPLMALLVLLVVSLPGLHAVRVLEIDVPPRVQVGDTVTLNCRYDLEGAALYSLNWWRGSDQFYVFSPNGEEQMTIYEAPGIKVDMDRSGRDTVVLRNVSQASTSLYKCEVLADYPSFEKDSDTANMEVIDVPSSPPMIFLPRKQWSLGEILQANCTSPGARPPPQIHWFINGEDVPPQNVRMATYHHLQQGVDLGGRQDSMGAQPRTSLLKMRLKSSHFGPAGQATLTCGASLPGLYHRSDEVILHLPGFRPASPSQKLYGGAVRSCCAAPMLVVLVLTVLAL